MSREVKRSSQFKKDFKRFRHDSSVLSEFTTVLTFLKDDVDLPEKYRDHALHNNWEGFRDCHIKSDVVLIYQKYEDIVKFLKIERIGSHSELGL